MNASSVSAKLEPMVLLERRAGIAFLTLNRPAQYNVLSEEMLAALQGAFDALAADASVRVVVLAGAGKAFCAGHDLKQIKANPSLEYYQRLFDDCSRFMMRIRTMPQPVIARVQGTATAAGCQLVAMCDLAIASEDARFAVSGINVGLFCATPSVALTRNIGRKAAFEMLVTGEFIDAAVAMRRGLINRCVMSAVPIAAKPAPYQPKNKVRFVTATSLFDGHDASVNIMRRILQASGAEVIHLGHNRSVQEIVNAALQEDVQGVAITSYQGGHVEFFKYMIDLLRQNTGARTSRCSAAAAASSCRRRSRS
jgi:enoyl-CoA hydratase/carnithine racemase